MSQNYEDGRVLEIVERRQDQRWYTARRILEPNEWPGSATWWKAQGGTGSRFALRWVWPTQPFLSASSSPYENQSKGEAAKVSYNMNEDKARRQGNQLAQALCLCFVLKGDLNPGAVYGLARTLAELSDQYSDKDMFLAFTDGFLTGFKQDRAQLNAPE